MTAALVVALAVSAMTGMLLLVLYEPTTHLQGFPVGTASPLSRVLLVVDTIARQASVVLSLVWAGISLGFAPRGASRRVAVLIGGLVVVVCCLAAWYFTSLVPTRSTSSAEARGACALHDGTGRVSPKEPPMWARQNPAGRPDRASCFMIKEKEVAVCDVFSG